MTVEIWNIIVEIFGALTGLLYVYLEIKQRRWMWIVGGISAIVYIYVFLVAGLYAMMAFQFYYVVISLYGWRQWGRSDTNRKGGSESMQITVTMPRKVAIISGVVIFTATLLFWQLLGKIDSDPMPFADALVVVLSMVATYWVSKKYIEHWILWIFANTLSIYIYLLQQLYATMVLYIIFVIAAIVGFCEWRKFRRVLNNSF